MKMKRDPRVTGASKEGEGGGEDVTILGQTTEQGKIGLLSQWTMEG